MKNRRGSSRPAAKGLTTSWLLATALPVCFGLVPLQAEATADEVGGDGTTTPNPVVTSNTVWTVLESQSVSNPNNYRYCTATCSADGLNPGSFGSNQYRFRVSLNGQPLSVNGAYERTLGFQNTNLALAPPMFYIADSIREITTTGGPFTTPIGTSFIKCEARKFLAATPNLTVDDVSLTVTCTDTLLP